MTFESLDLYCLSKVGAEASYPFDEVTRVYKVRGKMFALSSEKRPLTVNLKCDPLCALELRSLDDEVIPGYHMNKKHWNSVIVDSDTLDDEMIKSFIDDSYSFIVTKLSKKEQALLYQKN
jgi:predicted DNA-binding protein (MmcQ/YjbR family)